MEKRQLNLNQPLLSVRRAPSMSDPSEVSRWKTLDSKPTLPPLPYYNSELNSGPIRKPGVVPFQWEQMPGRPKHEDSTPKDNVWKSAVAPKLPPRRIANHKKKPIIKTPKDSPGSRDLSVLDKFEGSEKETKEKEISTREDDNVAFVDADETLSRKEPLFNSGVSGTLHAVSRKDPGVREELKPVKKVIKWKPQSPHYSLHRNVHAKDDEEENEDECAGMDDMSVKLCGLLPKFCLLNPIPGMRDHTQTISSVRSVRTRSPAYTDSFKKSEKKDRIHSHTGDMKRVPHQSDSKNEPSINENIGSQSMLPLADGSPQLFPDKEERFVCLHQQCIDLKAGKHDLCDNNGITTFRELISLDAAQENTSPPNPAIEKTLYVDNEPIELSRNSISSSPESRGRNPSVDSLEDISMTCLDEKQKHYPKSSEKSFQDIEDLHRDQVFNLGVVVLPQRKQHVKEGNRESGLLALGSLLPKSPSESWLSRTLPSMPTKNPYSKLVFRPSPVDPKCKRMLRSPNLQQTIFRPARELGPILEN